jgi:hypothetical protein
VVLIVLVWSLGNVNLLAQSSLQRQKNTSEKKIGVSVPKYGTCKVDWDKYRRVTDTKFKAFVKVIPKRLSDKELMARWQKFVTKDLNMQILNNSLIKAVVFTPVGVALDILSGVKKAVNMDSKFEDGNLYLYKGKNF